MKLRTARQVIVIGLAIAALPTLVDYRWVWQAMKDAVYPPIQAVAKWRDKRPPSTLPIRRGDRERYPRSSFGFVLKYDEGFRVDTFAGTATKDLIPLPDTTIALRLSAAQLDTLYDAVIGMRLFDYAEPHPPIGKGWSMVPSFTVRLEVRAGQGTKILYWDTGEQAEVRSDEWKRLDQLTRSISRMVTTHPAYRALPEPTSAYL